MGSGIVFLLAAVAFAQTTGTITGTVVDLAGDPVANAPIHATNVATKRLYTTTSSEKGGYAIAQLPAGDYELSVDQSWLDSIGHPHTEMLHIVERLHRVDLGHLEIEFAIEDPGTYSKP